MTNMKKFAANAILGLCVLASSAASATVINFDDFAYTDGNFAGLTTYQGFTWTNMYAYNPASSSPGYSAGVVSGQNIGFNGSGDAASFSSVNPFSLQSIEVTKAWNNGLTHFAGYVGNTLTYQMDVFSTTTGPTHAVFNWSNLSRVIMSDGNNTFQTAIDNLTVNAVAIPEPASGITMLTGLALIAFMARRRKQFQSK